MLRTLKNLFKQDREKFVVPKSVQNVIPIKTIWDDGIFLVGRNKYAKTFKFEDINYAVASREDKEAMFLEYSELLNSLDSGATTKITINNRRLNKADFEQTILIPMADDGLDKYRKEYNKMLLDKATGANSIVQDKYVTVSVCKKNIEEAETISPVWVLTLSPTLTVWGRSVWNWTQATSCVSSTTSTVQEKKQRSTSILPRRCGKVTISRILSALIPLNLRATASEWVTDMGV